jgi:hypothetical protein
VYRSEVINRINLIKIGRLDQKLSHFEVEVHFFRVSDFSEKRRRTDMAAQIQAAGAAQVGDNLTPMERAITWMGFTQNQRGPIISDIGSTFTEVESLTSKDISELAESYSKRTVNDGRIIFGLQRTKRLKAFIHWVMDFKRVNRNPTLDGLNQDSFCEALRVAEQRW